MAIETTVRSKSVALIVVLAAIAFIGGCAGGQVVVPPGSTPGNPGRITTPPDDEETEPPVQPSGTWTGTITINGVINEDKTEDGSSGDVGSTYYETYTKHDVTQLNATDTFNITANDPEDQGFGIGEIDLGGTSANAGSTLERYVTTYDAGNASCGGYTEEDGVETKGSWTESGKAAGTLQLNNDGSYSIEIHPNLTLPTGYEPDGPKLPYRNWKTFSNLAAGCVGSGWDTTTTSGPVVDWVSSFLGEVDANDTTHDIDGQISGTPGSTLDGSSTWKIVLPAMTIAVTWHLVHSIPIVLPHD